MSLLPPEVNTALVQLLQSLQSSDNTVRGQAEEQLNTEWVNQRPDVLLMGLAEQMQDSQDEAVSIPKDKPRDGDIDVCVDSIVCRRHLQAHSDAHSKGPGFWAQ